ncbi:uncharacterized protein LOC114586166 isoform X2 [Podarcis muralis]
MAGPNTEREAGRTKASPEFLCFPDVLLDVCLLSCFSAWLGQKEQPRALQQAVTQRPVQDVLLDVCLLSCFSAWLGQKEQPRALQQAVTQRPVQGMSGAGEVSPKSSHQSHEEKRRTSLFTWEK